MSLLHNIRTVARYEATTLRRSWFFRLFSISALVIFTSMNIGLFSPVGDEDWSYISNPATVPLVNLFLLNIAQAVVVIFLASDFLKRDKKVDTNEVLYTRSMSNFEYVIGKSAGILRLFLGLDIIILLIGLLMNIISKSMTIDLTAYIAYLLILCIPTILFSLGLAFMLMSLIRNQAITFLLLLGIAALNMFWLWYRAGYIFDYMAFGLPVLKSTIVGFDNMDLILSQRLMYTFLGLVLVLATILLFKRLPQSKLHTTLTWTFMVVFAAGAIYCGFRTWSTYKGNVNDKALVIETNKIFENRNTVSLTSADISLTHKGRSIEASAGLIFVNDNRENLDKYFFSINPGLKVSEVKHHGTVINFKATGHIVEIEAPSPLLPGEKDSLTISYSGTIKESFCFPDNDDNPKDSPYRIDMMAVNKRQAFLSPGYLLLTPESYWYPVAGLNYYPTNPARIKVDFTEFSLAVLPPEGLVAVSQGSMIREGDWFRFTADSPLTGLTLAIGDYMSDTLKVDSVSYISYYYPGHDYYKKDLAELGDTLNLLVSGIMRELETSFSVKYPFRTLSLLEVPVQYFSYPKMSTQTRAELQPSMVLLPEKLSTLQNAGFGKQFSRQKKRMTRSNQVITDKELQVRLFNNFVRNTFISGENFRYRNGEAINEPVRYRLGPSFYFFRNNFYSSEYPVINAVFESHLQKVTLPAGGARSMMGTMTDNDKAYLILRESSFRDVLAMIPGSDTIRAVLTVKGDYLFNLMRARAGIEEFKTWFQEYMNLNKFKRVDILSMNEEMKNKFGFELYPYLSDWFTGKEQPGFIFEEPQASEILVGDRVRYMVTFVASNPEKVPGIFNVAFRTGGPGGGRGGGQMMMGMFQAGPGGGGQNITISMQGRGMEASDVSKIIEVGPGQAKQLSMILDAQPRAMMINTLAARNIPGEINIPLGEPKKLRSRNEDYREEEIVVPLPPQKLQGEIIVDNEDPGFISGVEAVQAPLKRFFGINSRRDDGYQQINMFWAPEHWQPVVQSTYHGTYVLSAVYTRGGTGDKSVTWNAEIKEPGYYDVYCFIGKQTGGSVRINVQRGGGPGGGGPGGGGPGGGPRGGPMGEQQGESPYKDMHYKIYHDEGVEEITVDFENAEGGWNKLGQYYLSPDSAKVELTNKSGGRIVLGDAIKWVKVN
ncbi:MAG: hypothetical protein MUE74_01730 [Bacteroidales bacterium]|jgi:hypothetical protein|nr:hypothetical protein [Bacteroidales bacterium]